MSSAEVGGTPAGRPVATVLGTVLSTLLLLGAAAGPLPRVERDGDGLLWLERLPPVLADDRVAGRLDNGLTTVVLLRIEAGGEAVGALRIDIRYELWDEVFLVAVRGPGPGSEPGPGSGELHRLADSAELGRWWSALRLAGGRVPAGSAGEASAGRAPRQATVELEVVPFSQAEQLDTQRWFEESVERAERRRESGGEEVSGGAGLERVLTTLMATSIRRRPVTSYRWQVAIEPEDAE